MNHNLIWLHDCIGIDQIAFSILKVKNINDSMFCFCSLAINHKMNSLDTKSTVIRLWLGLIILTWVWRGGLPRSARTWPGPSPAWPPASPGSSSLSPSPNNAMLRAELCIVVNIIINSELTWSLIFNVPITLRRSVWDFFLAEFNRAWKWECLFWNEAEILESVLQINKLV